MASPKPKLSYRDAGVDTRAGQSFVASIAEAVQATHNPFVVKDKAGFAGMLDLSLLKNYKRPLLVSATDGVGTKLHLARLFDRHESVGIDLVAMCTNDLLATGAKPLQFLDYIACGRLQPQKMQSIVEGISQGCLLADCVLAGGETAEHPDTMHPEEYDLAGFAVGAVDYEKRITGEAVSEGDVLIALPSSGVHSNGLSLLRRLFLKDGLHLPKDKETQSFLRDKVLLKPTIIYEKILRPLLDKYAGKIHGISHITGGGFFENIPRILPAGLSARIDTRSYALPEIFQRIQKAGVEKKEMYHVFNMGAGMILAIDKKAASAVLSELKQADWQGQKANTAPWIIGEIVADSANKQVLFDGLAN